MSDSRAGSLPEASRASDDRDARPPPTRRTIAVLVDWLTDGYQNMVFAGMADAARAADVNLLCLAGGVLRSPARQGSQRNFIYEFVAPGAVDGVLLMSGTLGNYVGPAELGRYCERFAPLPLVSVAVPVPGIPTVVVQDTEGMKDAVRHLTRTHGYRSIALIRGPEVNDEAQRRFKAYRDVLAESGISFEENLVAPGDFQFESGVDAIRLLLDERRVSFDALVAVNDHMLLGALHELHRRGISVPSQVALVGFDDIEEARFADPPLTTVRQPLYQQGAQALKILLDQASGRPTATTFHMKTELVIRESCGCFGPLAEPDADASLLRVAWSDDTLEQRVSSRREEVCRLMTANVVHASSLLPPGWDAQLLEAWLADVVADNGIRFLPMLRKLVAHTAGFDVDAGSWQGVVTAMRRLLSPLFVGHEARRAMAEDLWHKGREEIAMSSVRSQARQRLRFDGWARALSEVSESLSATTDTQSLVSVLVEKMPRCGIPAAYLCLFEDVARPAPSGPAPTRARLLLAYGEGSTFQDDPNNPRPPFPLSNLLPDRTWPQDRRWTIVVEPLFVVGQPLGYLLLEVGPREGIVYEALRKQVSGAINGVRIAAQNLRDAEGRMQGLKLEAIGTLAAGIAHQMNTPIQYAGDSMIFLKDALDSYQRATAAYRRALLAREASAPPSAERDHPPIETADVIQQAEDLIYLESEIPDAWSRCQDGLRRVSEVVNAMREFARADSKTAAPADINRAILNTLQITRSEYTNWADLETQLGEVPEVPCFIGELNQVFLSLIINAAHAIEDVFRQTRQRGKLTLRSSVVENHVVVEIEDTGGGIPVAIQDKVFDPFFTTKALGRGSGQGLAIARSAIVGHHRGTLTFESRPGVGTVFRVRLPILHTRQSP